MGYLEDKPNVQGLGQEWYFDLDYLTDTLGYTRFKANQPTGTQDTHINAGSAVKDTSGMKMTDSGYAEELTMLQRQEHEAKDAAEQFGFEFTTDTEELLRQATIEARRNLDPSGSVPVPAGSEPVHAAHTPLPPAHFTRYSTPSDLDVNSLVTKRVNTIHPQSLILRDHTLAVQTRTQALEDPGWVDAMQEEMQQFLNQNVWKLVPLPEGKTAIRTKWILKNKRDTRGIVVRNKARLVAQGHW
ncbi:putative ribonuclease H-like domain-containing protein [Tanacetum coccineum]